MTAYPTSFSEAARRLPGASLLLALPAVLIFALPALTSVLEYDRTALAAGELWRLGSCHWTHWDGSHLLWDLLTFLVLAALCEDLDRRRLLTALGLGTLAIPTAIWAIQPEIGVYRGLSGLDATLFALYLGLLRSRMRSQGRSSKWPLAAFALLGAKVLYETATGQTLFLTSVEQGPVVVPLAHLIGGLVGWLVGSRLGRQAPASTGWAAESAADYRRQRAARRAACRGRYPGSLRALPTRTATHPRAPVTRPGTP